MNFALIKDGVVQNVIIAEQDFIDKHIAKDYDAAVPVSLEPGSPGISWKYDGKSFSEPDPVIPEDPKDTLEQKVDKLGALLLGVRADLDTQKSNIKDIADKVGIAVADVAVDAGVVKVQ